MEKIILTDCDGVLLNWGGAFEQWMTDHGHPRIPGTEDEYSIEKRHEGVTYDMAQQMIEDFNTSKALRYLAPYKDSEEYVAKLVEEGFRFIAVTAVSDDPVAEINRRYNLMNRFGDIFDEIHCTPLGESKQGVLRKGWGGSGLLWIEDHFKNAEAGYEEGLRPIVVDTPYNRAYQTTLFPRVDAEQPWKEIYQIVQDLYG